MTNIKKLDSVRQALEELKEALGLSHDYLAGLLGVTGRSLDEWKKKGMGDLRGKVQRLIRLHQVLHYVENNPRRIQKKDLRNFLENARITVDPDDEEDGTVSLINYIIHEPEATTWVACVKEAVSDFFGDEEWSDGIESDRSAVQNA